MNKDYPQDLQEAIEFHGHFCPGLAIGYRAAKAALEKLAAARAGDEELVAIVETDACGVDAVQSLLGCTMGKGNLIYKDYGKQVYTVASRKQGKAVRVALKPDAFPQPPGADALRAAVFGGTASAEQRKEFQQLQQARIGRLLAANTDELFKVEWVDMPLPQPARIFGSVVCGFCGEAVMEPRARLQDGKIACLSCHEEYTRGW
ncbi:FmdE family protein [Anaeroselena agilis]|uniref:FmdE family protein n=1 Tax=Anaeroselena agilis TaxID=3063788 RepID=A0ABU3NZB6_9FIRM|nr:FmdE family protein [Selenomonadales bacterium 4137-cl]